MELNKNIWNSEDFIEFKNYLISLGNKDFLDFHKKLVPGESLIIGIKIPILREIAKKISKGNFISFLELKANFHEEKLVKIFVLSYIKDFDLLLNYLDGFVYEIDNWAVCDSITCLKLFKKNLDKGFKFIDNLLLEESEYVIRSGFVLLLSFYINDDYIDYILRKVVEVKFDAYYVKMVIAWLISVCFVKYPDKTILILDGRLDKFTHNKAISKICDSFRVDNRSKENIKKYRLK